MMMALGANVPPSLNQTDFDSTAPTRPKIEDITDLPEENVAAATSFVDETPAPATQDTAMTPTSGDSAADSPSQPEEPVSPPTNPLRLYTYDEIRQYLLYKYGPVEYTIQLPPGIVSYTIDAPIQFIIANKLVAVAQLRNGGRVVVTNTGDVCLTLLFSHFMEVAKESPAAETSTAE